MADDTGPKSQVPAHSCAHTYDARNNSLVVAGARPQTKYLGVDKLVPSPCFSTSLTKTPFPSPYSQQTVAMTSRGSGSPRPSESSTDTCLIVSPKHHGRTRREELLLHADNLVVKDFVPHPYARLYNKKHKTGRCRKVWSHALEKFVFTHEEIVTMGAQERRKIYLASLEAHIDQLHEQLLSYSLAPVPLEMLVPYGGLNKQTAKSMISGLQHDAAELKLKLLEIGRANKNLEQSLNDV